MVLFIFCSIPHSVYRGHRIRDLFSLSGFWLFVSKALCLVIDALANANHVFLGNVISSDGCNSRNLERYQVSQDYANYGR